MSLSFKDEGGVIRVHKTTMTKVIQTLGAHLEGSTSQIVKCKKVQVTCGLVHEENLQLYNAGLGTKYSSVQQVRTH